MSGLLREGQRPGPALVLNAGSSTLKASVLRLPAQRPMATASVTWTPTGSGGEANAALGRLLDELGLSLADEDILAVGHRIVHGGKRFRQPVLIDDAVLGAIGELSELAPLHNPPAIATIRAARARFPDARHVACFDTAFHASLPETSYRYPVPERWFAEWGIRRFGFHGLSTEWAVARSAELLGVAARDLQLVVAHLGSGCSVTAVDGGRSVATSMGFTPLEGVMMATRAGSIDPGVLLWLLDRGNMRLPELENILNHGGGLVAIAGTGDMQRLLAEAAARDKRAALAIDMFVERAAAGIAAAASHLRRLDGLVFTGGIGEHAGSVRSRIVRRLAVLGIAPVPARRLKRDRILSVRGERPAVLRVEAREDIVIASAALRLARQTRRPRTLSQTGAQASVSDPTG
jgi:acetate kinase